jgi:uncharacterized repeat protein (TIGR01451 family)
MIPKNVIFRKIFLVSCCAFLMVSLLGIKAQAESLPSENGKNVAAPDALLIHNTVVDFDQTCVARTNTHISDNLGGSVELAGALNDNFDGETLNSSLWASGSWIEGSPYTPVVSGGKVLLPAGGYIRSNSAVFTRGVVDAKVEFGQGAWQHVGFGTLDLVNSPRFLFFSTFNTHDITSTLYARVELLDSYHYEPINPWMAGLHRYRVEWVASDATYDQANFYRDGILVYPSSPFTNTNLSNLNLWMSNAGTQNLSVDEIQVAPPYAASGTYISCPLDATAGQVWQNVSWVNIVPAGTSLIVQTRTSLNGSGWTEWTTIPISGGSITSPNRFMQYQLLLGTNNVNITPALDSISLSSMSEPAADLRVTKSGSPDPAIAGTDVTYGITVQNLGPANAASLVLTDTLPTGMTYKSVTPGSWTCTTPTVGKVRCTLDSLGVASSNVTIKATVNPDTRVSVTNWVDVKSASADPDLSNNTFQEPTTISTLADLELNKVVLNSTPVMGGTEVFTLTVTNKGPSQATGVKVNDLLASGYQFTGATASPGSYDQVTGDWTIPSLAVDQTATLRITGMVKGTGTYNNYAQVSASNEPDSDSTPNDNSTDQDDDASVIIAPVPGADLSLVKLASKSAPYVGDPMVFTMTVTNAGPSASTGVVVKDSLPSGFTFIGSNLPGSYNASTGYWEVGTLPANESRLLVISAQVNQSGIYQNNAEVWLSQILDPDSTAGNGAATEDDYGRVTLNPLPQADLSVEKTLISNSPLPGQDIVFQIKVINSGPSSAEGVTISDVLPSNHVFVGSDHTAVNNNGVLTWNLGTMAANQEVRIVLTLRTDIVGPYTNRVQVMTSSVHDPDSQPGNSVSGEDDLSSLQYDVEYQVYLPVIQKSP